MVVDDMPPRGIGAAHDKKMNFFMTFMQFSTRKPCTSTIIPVITPKLNSDESPCAMAEDIPTNCRLTEVLGILQRGVTEDCDTYASLMQACAKTDALVEGKQIHTHILICQNEKNLFLGNTLISMYAKCGSLVDARLVFDKTLKRNVVSWNSMIRGYTMHRHYEEALTLYYEMQGVGMQPDNFTFSCVLKSCAGLSALKRGEEVHDRIIRSGFESDVRVSKALVNMYAKCGSVGNARQVFDGMSQRDVVSWNVMITGYSQNGEVPEALKLFRQMQLTGEKPSAVTIASVLPSCAQLRTIELGKNIHNYSIKSGLESHLVVGNALVTMYAKCWRIGDACQVFYSMSQRDVVSWNAMIAGYGRNGNYDEALRLFCQMMVAGVKPNSATVATVLSICAHLEDIHGGKEIHDYVIRTGLELDVSVGNALVAMYAKCRSVKGAHQVFDGMHQKDAVSWNAIVAGYSQNGHYCDALKWFHEMQLAGIKPDPATMVTILPACAHLGDLQQGKEIHDYIIRSGAFECDIDVANALVTLYAKCGGIEDARRVFDGMSQRDVVSWNAMLAGYAQNGHCDEALNLFHQMQMAGVKPDSITISSVLSVCGLSSALKQGKEIHSYIIRSNFVPDLVVGNALVDMYAKSGHIKDARHVFDKMPDRNVVSSNAMISGYAKCGNKEDAQEVFDKMPERAVASWNVMIALYSQNEDGDKALKLFREVQLAGMKLNTITIASILPACAQLAVLQLGKEIHAYIIKNGFDLDVFVNSALLDTYAKCGSIEDACQVFEKMPQRDVVTWTAMISGYAMHGHGDDALATFYQMQRADVKPDHITFTAVLSACSHAGLVDKGLQFFDCMIENYCIMPSSEQYACVVDLLGRAGRLDEAHDFIRRMPLEPNGSVWGALLGACRIHCNAGLGEHAAEHLFELEPNNTGNYILLSNIYAMDGRWDGVEKMRKMMKDRGLEKMPGCSWIEIKNKVHAFLVGDI